MQRTMKSATRILFAVLCFFLISALAMPLMARANVQSNIDAVANSSHVPALAPAEMGETKDRVVLDKGHTDIFNVSAPSADALNIELKEDVTGSHVLHAPEDVYLKVPADRFTEMTKQIKGIESSGYFLPMVQDNNSLWPGWDTFGVAPHFKTIDIVLDEVQGPGTVFAVSQGNLGGGVRARALDGQTSLHNGSVIRVDQPAHEHLHWVFSKKGIYTFKARAQGKNQAGQVVTSRVATYTWLVDTDVPAKEEPKPDNTDKPQPDDTEKPQPDNTDKPQPAGTEKPQSDPVDNSGNTPGDTGSDTGGDSSSDANGDGSVDAGDSGSENNSGAGVEEKPQGGSGDASDKKPQGDSGDASDKKPQNEPEKKPEKNSEEKSEKDSGNANSETINSGSSTKTLVPPPPTNTLSAEECIPTKVPATPENIAEAKKYRAQSTGASASGGAGQESQLGGSVTIPKNTHVHQNWVFNKTGKYTVTITQSTTLKSGKTISADAVLKFIVGGSGTANEGHFDLGAEVKDGKLIPLMKDDRKQPAKWIDPSSVTFGLGSKAKLKAPKEMSFIADEGADVWVIPSVQIAGVPWLGANTMTESIEKETKGTITWRLKSVEGSGQLAVFESGNFGKAVGKHWFGGRNGASGSSDSSTAASSASTTNDASVLNSDGKTVTVGRTPSGQPCELAKTGVSSATVPLLVSGLMMVILGGLMIAWNMRHHRLRTLGRP